MATRYWCGRAHSVRYIATITVANTWAAADTVVCKINEKELTITCGSTTTTTALVATAIKEAWNAASRLDGTSASSDATSNFGGQEFGEFREAVASVSGSVVTITALTPGKPITIAVTEVTATTGTATLATAQAATGKNHWDNADNWIDSLDLTTGSTGVPANDDVVDFRNSDISCLYGLPNGSLEVTFNVWKSYAGEIGLPAINRDDPSYPYPEYRQRYVRLDDAGTGTDIAHRFGIGSEGTGCRLCNLKHSTLKCSPIIYSTGTPRVERVGEKALNMCCTANTSTINILGGSVDFSSQDGGTSAFVTVTQSGGDARCVGSGIYTTLATVSMRGGTLTIGQAGQINTVTVRGGTVRIENQIGSIGGVNCFRPGIVEYNSSATITDLVVSGRFDARGDAGRFVVTTGSLYDGAEFLDPYQRMNPGTFRAYYDWSDKVQFGGAYGAGITIDY